MDIKEIENLLSKEIIRLARINDTLEAVFPKTEITYKEPELIKENIYIMLEIYKLLIKNVF